MDSTRPIRALMRGLDALTVLNLRDGATVSEVAHEIRLPRTTVYRILETLCNSGFVYRDSTDERYRLTILVRGLSGGFDDEAWVNQIAKPLIYALCTEIVWPVSIATLSGTKMMLREATDHSTPLAIERYSAGFQLPLLTTADRPRVPRELPARAARRAHRHPGALQQGRGQAGARSQRVAARAGGNQIAGLRDRDAHAAPRG